MTTKPLRLTRPEPTEAAVLDGVLRALKVHPRVAYCWRQNTGAFAIGEGRNRRFTRFGQKGHPDIHGYMKDGRALFVEVKKPSGRVTQEQADFIKTALQNGCVAFIARSVDDVFRNIECAAKRGSDA